jgi:hypothetical protein
VIPWGIVLKAALIGILAAGAIYVVASYNRALRSEARLTSELEVERGKSRRWMEAAAAASETLSRERKAAANLERTRREIAARLERANGEIERLRNDKPSAEWLDTRLPDRVIERLRGSPDSGAPGSKPVPEAVDGRTLPDGGAEVQRPDQRGSPPLR